MQRPKSSKKKRMFNKCIHVLQNLNLSFPFVAWDEKMVSGEEFKQTNKKSEMEMACSFAVNIGFSIVMLLPVWFTGNLRILECECYLI